ncbi:MAG TPA: BrnT family toxin [Acidobacteriaceae bacterium]|nr:BrnT family toxin [Acidobacteriaceae bacterium]
MDIAEFEWDAKKAASNLRKHGVSFPFASRALLDEHRIEQLDDRENYGETRFITIGLVADFEIVVIYTLREENIRIISARKADLHEIEAYWNS